MKNTFDFTRIHQSKILSCLDNISDITISNITLIKKDYKHESPYIVEINRKKFGYTIHHKPQFMRVGGSNTYPRITFKGKYIDIHVKNFPYYPAYYQDIYAVKSCLSGWGYTNYLNKGFPYKEVQERIEILNLKQNKKLQLDKTQ